MEEEGEKIDVKEKRKKRKFRGKTRKKMRKAR